MKLRNLLAGIFLTACCLIITSCGDDDYSPITLVYASEKGEMPIDENNHLPLTPFSKGESFLIRGGSGDYHIKTSDKEIVNFYYDGDTLTIFPISPIPDFGEIIITDRAKNSYLLTVDIDYLKKTFEVTELGAEVTGSGLKQSETAELTREIAKNHAIKNGSKYIMTYTEGEDNAGSVIVTPEGYKGTFSHSEEWTVHDNNMTLTQYTVELDGVPHYYDLYKTIEDGEIVSMEFHEDVTSQYKNDYPELERATCIIKLK